MSKFETWKAARQKHLEACRHVRAAREAAVLAENERNEAWVALSIAASELSPADKVMAVELEYGSGSQPQRD